MIYFLAFIAGTALCHGLVFFPRLTIGLLLIGGLYLIFKRRAPVALMLVLGFALAFVRLPHEPPPQKWDNPITLTGYFPEQARQYDYYNVQGFTTASDTVAPHPKKFDIISSEIFETGRQYTLKLRMITPTPRLNPGAWSKREPYARLREVVATGKLMRSPLHYMSRLSANLSQEINRLLPPDEASLVRAITTGQKSEMPRHVKEAFRRAGLAHLLSISGTHFGFFALAIFFILRTALERLPERYLLLLSMRLSPAQTAAILAMPMLLFYLGLSGGNPPAARAFVMISLFLFGLLVSARGRWDSFLAAAAFVLVLADPSVLGTGSFLLSFSAVLFIGLIMKNPQVILNKELDVEVTRNVKTLRVLIYRPLQLTIAATLGVMPFLLNWFHELSIISPIANVAVTGLAGFLLIPLSLAGAVGYALTGSFFTAPLVEPVAHAAIWLAEAMSSPEWVTVPVPPMPPIMVALYFACILPWLITRSRRLFPLAFLPFMLYAGIAINATFSQQTSITFLDTGSSDASVIELTHGKTIVVDTARRGNELRGYLWSKGTRDIDLLILSHPHADHTGGAVKLSQYFNIKEVWMPIGMNVPEGFPADIETRYWQRGDTLKRWGMTFTALHPFEGFTSKGKYLNARINDYSLVLRLSNSANEGLSLIMAGDLQASGISTLKQLGKHALKTNILKLPHHGRNRAESNRMIKLTNPALAIVTGKERSFGSNEDVPQIISTGQNGAIKIYLDSEPPAIKTYREFSMANNPKTFGTEVKNLAYLFSLW